MSEVLAAAASIAEAIKWMKVKSRLDAGQMYEPLTNPASDAEAGFPQQVRGWLRHVWRKATTKDGDDWGPTGDGPHPWWDKYTGPPMTSFQRFDLHELSYPLVLLANKTPAWREVYAEILQRVTERYTTHWAAVDWLNQFGNDPDEQRYPSMWKGTSIPSHVFGKGYNTPGWTGNGLGKNGVEADPIAADGMLFFKGFLTLLMSITERMSGNAGKWEQPWPMAGVGGTSQAWTLSSMAHHLAQQWSNYESGLH